VRESRLGLGSLGFHLQDLPGLAQAAPGHTGHIVIDNLEILIIASRRPPGLAGAGDAAARL
jgi:hypothetical protein